MQKQILTPHLASVETAEPWLDVAALASVELTSEDPQHPIENVFATPNGAGWRASEPGEQTVRLVFHKPQHVRRIQLEFVEDHVERTQEFVLEYAAAPDAPLRELRRQQWNFSPTGSTNQVEHYIVDLEPVAVLQLRIDPDRGRLQTAASLRSWLIA